MNDTLDYIRRLLGVALIVCPLCQGQNVVLREYSYNHSGWENEKTCGMICMDCRSDFTVTKYEQPLSRTVRKYPGFPVNSDCDLSLSGFSDVDE